MNSPVVIGGEMGPNVERLIARKMAVDAVQSWGKIGNAIRWTTRPEEALADSAAAARRSVLESIAAVKAAANNPHGDDDEAIAGEILRLAEERDAQIRVSKAK
jgi:hypothetical protein